MRVLLQGQTPHSTPTDSMSSAPAALTSRVCNGAEQAWQMFPQQRVGSYDVSAHSDSIANVSLHWRTNAWICSDGPKRARPRLLGEHRNRKPVSIEAFPVTVSLPLKNTSYSWDEWKGMGGGGPFLFVVQ